MHAPNIWRSISEARFKLAVWFQWLLSCWLWNIVRNVICPSMWVGFQRTRGHKTLFMIYIYRIMPTVGAMITKLRSFSTERGLHGLVHTDLEQCNERIEMGGSITFIHAPAQDFVVQWYGIFACSLDHCIIWIPRDVLYFKIILSKVYFNIYSTLAVIIFILTCIHLKTNLGWGQS